MEGKKIIFDNFVSLINKSEILELHIFTNYISKNSFFFHELDFLDFQMIKLF